MKKLYTMCIKNQYSAVFLNNKLIGSHLVLKFEKKNYISITNKKNATSTSE